MSGFQAIVEGFEQGSLGPEDMRHAAAAMTLSDDQQRQLAGMMRMATLLTDACKPAPEPAGAADRMKKRLAAPDDGPMLHLADDADTTPDAEARRKRRDIAGHISDYKTPDVKAAGKEFHEEEEEESDEAT